MGFLIVSAHQGRPRTLTFKRSQVRTNTDCSQSYFKILSSLVRRPRYNRKLKMPCRMTQRVRLSANLLNLRLQVPEALQTAKKSVFLRIQVRASSQTKGLARGRVRRARFARVRLLRHALPISLLILRKNRLFCSLEALSRN